MAGSIFTKCLEASCPDEALSFSGRCWAHEDHGRYLSTLCQNIRSLTPSLPFILNLKKVRAADLDFSGLDIRGSSFSQAHLSNCSFIGCVLFDSDLIGAKFTGCDFIGSDICRSNFTKATISSCSFSHSDLRGVYFVEANFRDTDFMGTVLFDCVLWNADLLGARNIKLSNFINPDSKKRRPSYHLSESNAVGAYESYRNLKHYFYRNGLYEAGSWAAYRGLKMECRNYFEKKDPRFIPSIMMDLLSGYTEKPSRVILSSLVIIATFGLIYYLFNIPVSSSLGSVRFAGFWDCLYFSFITFTTVGFGDFIPRSIIWFRLITCVEAFSGPFMAGLFVFTLTRRYAAS